MTSEDHRLAREVGEVRVLLDQPILERTTAASTCWSSEGSRPLPSHRAPEATTHA